MNLLINTFGTINFNILGYAPVPCFVWCPAELPADGPVLRVAFIEYSPSLLILFFYILFSKYKNKKATHRISPFPTAGTNSYHFFEKAKGLSR
jgi:hypothetical protein